MEEGRYLSQGRNSRYLPEPPAKKSRKNVRRATLFQENYIRDSVVITLRSCSMYSRIIGIETSGATHKIVTRNLIVFITWLRNKP
jgi:hypothetical protein